ncbi:unnamed protein product [Oppiella nova]|uniref:Uncharacterized protein n=1 Tax=Oppiella nova TaxID=334625 RepID=A0A7R9M6W2_9ACAR|nr:unnamed protein product [Oppiella nova]CAG2171591.1 unnamed protein product [Oppiella nova]
MALYLSSRRTKSAALLLAVLSIPLAYLMLQMRDRFNDNMKERICGSFDRVFSSCSTPTSGVQEMNISEPETETEN